MAEIYLVRHAQASFGADDYDALSAAGHKQARVLGRVLGARLPRIDAVVCGRMRRHHETADACLEVMERPLPIHEDPGWDEYDSHGVIQTFEPRYRDHEVMAHDLFATGDPGRAFNKLFHAAVEKWVSGGEGDYPEPWVHFHARVEAALERVARMLEGAQTAVVFTSGGPIMAVCRALLHLPDPAMLQLGFGLVNGSITKLVIGKRGIRVSSVNEHGHFAGEHASLLTLR